MRITISKSILDTLPDFSIVALKMDVSAYETNSDIKELINKYQKDIKEEYSSLEEVLNIPLIKNARDGYKKLGKDPSRYRLACESLLRRIVKGNDLYIINNLVDIGNILSIDFKRSTAVLDYDKIDGDIVIRKGLASDVYEGIGRGIINVENIPVYEDNISPFGSTTSDTMRTSVSLDTKHMLLFIVCFDCDNHDYETSKAIEYYTKYADAKNIEIINVEKEK
ncbi:MAG: hypothetical protein J5666_02415 [Bacilli bacterium]|nr:hypothetical protein [Bacilli bacterium]